MLVETFRGLMCFTEAREPRCRDEPILPQQECKCPDCKKPHVADVIEGCPQKDGRYLRFCEKCVGDKYLLIGKFRFGENVWYKTHERKPNKTWKQSMKDFEDY